MGVVAFKDLAGTATKFAQRGSNASGEYTKNAAAAAGDWHANTAASNDNWKTGTQDAMTRDAFAKGVAAAGPQAYASQVAAVGGTRFADGISKAGPKWQAGFGKVATLVAGKDLGPRGIKGSQQNKQRAANMSDAWRAAKLSAKG
jgi:hypothetical protein